MSVVDVNTSRVDYLLQGICVFFRGKNYIKRTVVYDVGLVSLSILAKVFFRDVHRLLRRSWAFN